jgi:quinol monooxygenase YgiN
MTRGEGMYRIVWEFEAREEALARFESAYGSKGAWADLFQRGADYVGTELFRSVDNPRRFVTVDTWRSRAAYEAFRKAHAAEYRAIDEACESLTVRERALGETELAGEKP